MNGGEVVYMIFGMTCRSATTYSTRFVNVNDLLRGSSPSQSQRAVVTYFDITHLT